jgi:hypothetical protein
MTICVETVRAPNGSLQPVSILGERCDLPIIEVVDTWHGSDYRYIKVIGADAHTYILRHSEETDEWDLVVFQRRRAEV